MKNTIDLHNAAVLVTGAAGFIGSNLAKQLLDSIEGIHVIGFDNVNDYYDVRLKEYRLNQLSHYEGFTFIKADLADKDAVNDVFEQYRPTVVVNLAAQAGVRYSITHPDAYIQSNLIGFYNILEACRHHPVDHLVYASSSSVYGSNKKVPYSTDDKVDFNSGGRCFIKRSYYARVTEGIHLSFDKCFFARFYKFCFSVYHFGKSVTKPDRCYGKFVPCGWF